MDELVKALRAGEQADMDGTLVKVSRQACEEAADTIEALQAQLAEARDKALEDAAQCCEREADRCDDAAIWGGSRTYVNNCKAAAYAMRDRANAIRAMKGEGGK